MGKLMAFGEHKGKEMSEVPLDYLQWCLATFEHSPRRTLIQIEVERRERADAHRNGLPEPDQLTQHVNNPPQRYKRADKNPKKGSRQLDDGFKIPSGKYKGKRLEELDTTTLQQVWSGFNGVGKTKVAAVLRKELDARKMVEEWKKQPKQKQIRPAMPRPKLDLDSEYQSIVGPPPDDVQAVLDARWALIKEAARKSEENLPITPEECPF
jgi:uncharacterized protein (DUF3820 family)